MKEARALLRRWEDNDPETRALWKKMNDWVVEGFKHTYERMGIGFEQVYYESDTYLLGKKVVEEGLARGVFSRRADGATIAHLDEAGTKEKVLLRADGTSVYMTQDLGTIFKYYKDCPFDSFLYVVGDEQLHHFKVLFALLGRLGAPYADKLRHVSYGMVDLPSGRMKSREGTVIDADALLDELKNLAEEKTRLLGKSSTMNEKERGKLYEDLALGAIRFFLLQVSPSKRMLFDKEAALDFQGVTGTLIQYTHARICSLLRRGEKEGISVDNLTPVADKEALRAEEQLLIRRLLSFEKTLEKAAQSYMPSLVAQWLYELARSYNRWYESHAIFKQDIPPALRSWRLWLSARTRWHLEKGLSLLGIAAPKRM